jgi:molybdenum cofactor guanylyltransferase
LLTNNTKNITVILLAGGQSSRMGKDKGLIELNGKPLIEHITEKVRSLTETVIIITNQPGYDRFGFPCFPDIKKDCGPMGGIFAGLHYSSAKKNLILSCDIPFVPHHLLEHLVEQSGAEDALVPRYDGKTEPLCGVYDRNCKETLKMLIDEKHFKLQNALKKLNTRYLDLHRFDDFDKKWFANINTPDELEKHQNKPNN